MNKFLILFFILPPSLFAQTQNLILNNKDTTMYGTYYFNNVSLTGSTINVPTYQAGTQKGQLVIYANSIIIDAGSTIFATGAGNAGLSVTGFGAGAGYGGQGGHSISESTTNGLTYGTLLGNGIQMGSTGNAANGSAAMGGGAVSLICNSLILHGTINANGIIGGWSGSNNTTSGGGGSGGGVLINSGNIYFDGSINALGGQGGDAAPNGASGGGGGGGRVKIFYNSLNNFGAIVVNGGQASSGSQNGFAGTIGFDNYPGTPSLIGVNVIGYNPVFSIFSTETNTTAHIFYKIEISSHTNFDTIYATYNQMLDPTGWSKVVYGYSDTAQFSGTNPLPVGRYYWRAYAYDGNVWSDGWNVYSPYPTSYGQFVINGIPNVVQQVSPLNNSVGNFQPVQLTWKSSSLATSYRLQYGLDPTFTTTLKDTSGITGTTYTANGLSNLTKYYWRVNATNSLGTSGWSNTWNFTTRAIIRGNVDGSGGPDAYSAALVLKWIVSLDTLNALQLAEADVDKDGQVTTNDVVWILYASDYGTFPDGSLPKISQVQTEIVTVGQLNQQENSDLVTIPVILENSQSIHGCYLALNIDPRFASVDSIVGSLPKGWLMVYNFANGVLKIAMAGIAPLTDGTIATISLKLKNRGANFTVSGSAKLNANINESINSFKVKAVPDGFALSQNYPNPFNPSTIINYRLPMSSFVTVKVYDELGNEVVTLVNEVKTAGNYSVEFNAGKLASGLYFYRMRAGNFAATKKLLLIK
jgi:hypothetical protein